MKCYTLKYPSEQENPHVFVQLSSCEIIIKHCDSNPEL